MAKQNVLMPQMGESIQEGTITKWHKKAGDKIQREEILLEISTDKVDTEIPSPATGVLTEILVKEGQTVKVNTVIAVIDASETQGEKISSTQTLKKEPQTSKKEEAEIPKKEEVQTSKKEATEVSKKEEMQTPKKEEAQTLKKEEPEAYEQKPSEQEKKAEQERVLASPLARKIAKEHAVNLSTIKGSGDGNKIVKEDVLSAIKNLESEPIETSNPQSAFVASALATAMDVNNTFETMSDGTRIKRVPMSAMRKKIADHMVMSKRVSPHVTSVIEIDLQKIVDLRAKHKDKFESQYGFKLTYMPFFMEAVLKAIKAVPIVNSSIEADTIVYKKDIHLGIAVALDWGLIVPVIKNAHEKNFVGLGHALNLLADKAREKKLLPDDVRGGTISITNFGGFGTVIGQPIINQPQVAIFGIGAMQKKPVVIHDAIAIRTMCYCVLSFDHRVVDGADSGKFLSAVKSALENWDTPL